MDRWRKFLFHFSAGLLPAAVFAWLAVMVWNGRVFVWDRTILDQLHLLSSPNGDAFWVAITRTGGLRGVMVILYGGMLLLVMRGQFSAALFLAVSYFGAEILHLSLKQIFLRDRPAFWISPAPEYSFSFPSGHALISSTVVLALILVTWNSRWRWPVLAMGTIFIILVGVSRSYLGVHYPSDVIASWCLASSWIALISIIACAKTDSTQDGVRFRYRRLLLLPVLLTGLPLGYAAHAWSNNNFHAVIPGQVYRSGQMNERELTDCTQGHGIRSLVNLRGENRGLPWYDEEIRTAQQLSLRHYDFNLSSADQVSPEKLNLIMEVLRMAPKPVLIHGKEGSDRTSLVAALYILEVARQPPEQAERQFSFWFGDWSASIRRMLAMDESFCLFVAYINARPLRKTLEFYEN